MQWPLKREGKTVSEGTVRALQEPDGTPGIPVPVSSGEDGCFERECPRRNANFNSRSSLEDWKAIVRDEEVFCPLCGHTADSCVFH